MEFNLQDLLAGQKAGDLPFDKRKSLTELVDFFLNLLKNKDSNAETLERFLLPFIHQDFSAQLIKNLCIKIPAEFPWDHREIYFDFRLRRWIKHVEPKTLKECMEEYWENSASNLEALKYFRGLLREFASRQV